jgi:hypothetical protein
MATQGRLAVPDAEPCSCGRFDAAQALLRVWANAEDSGAKGQGDVVLAAGAVGVELTTGAAHAARRAGDGAKASTYYTQLAALAERGDGTGPELREARAFLARGDNGRAA